MSTPMLGTGPMRGFGPMLGVGPMLGRSPLSGPVSQRPTFALDFARDQYSTLSSALTVSSPTGGVMVPDYLGNYHVALANEIPIRGGRRLYNLLTSTDTLATQGVTVEDADYWLSFKGTGSVAVTGVATDSLAGTGADDRVSKKVTMGSAGTATFTVTGSVTEAYLYKSRPGQTTADPEYVSRGVPIGHVGEFAINGGFDTDAGWNKSAGWTISGGTAVATAVAPPLLISQINLFPHAGTFEVQFTVLDYVSGAVSVYGPGYSADVQRAANGTYTETVTVTSAGSLEFKTRNASTTLKIDNVSVREIRYHGYGVDGLAWMRTDPEGNSLADAASGHPVLCTGIADWPQITNLAWPSESFAGQAITVTNGQPYTISFRGTGSIAYSGAASGTLAGTGADDLVSVTVTTTTTTLTLASPTGTVTEVQVTAGSAVQPHVPTTSSAVTADAIVKTLDDSLIGWVAGGGTMIVEQTPEQDASTGDILIDIKTDADNRILVSGAGGNTQLLVRDGASDVATINGTGWQAGVTQRVAAKVEANDAELVIDGASEGADTSLTVPAITTITLGGGQAKSIGAIAYYAAGA